MKFLKINVANEILKSQFGFAIESEYASSYINNEILSLDDTLFLIDFRGVVFDHYFARPFGELFDFTRKSSSSIDVIFQFKDFQINDFLLGILDFLEINYSYEDHVNLKNFFMENKISIKLMTEHDDVLYLSDLNESSKKILDFINEKIETSFDDIYTEKILESGEEINRILSDLIELRCIYSNKSEKMHYYSVYKYIK